MAAKFLSLECIRPNESGNLSPRPHYPSMPKYPRGVAVSSDEEKFMQGSEAKALFSVTGMAPTIAASLDSRYMSGLKEEREEAAEIFEREGLKEEINNVSAVDKKRLIDDVRQALYASKICSYAQGMNLLRAKSMEKGWGLNLGELARIWKGGCIIRAVFLDRIKQAYQRNPGLANLLAFGS